MTQLAHAVDADEKLWTIDTLPPSPYVQVDDELVEIRATFPEQIYEPTQEMRPPKIRVRRGVGATTAASHESGAELNPIYDPAIGTTFHVQRVTFDMEGLATEDNPAVPGIRLGDYVVPAGSFVLATVYVSTEFDAQPVTSSGPTLFPLIRNVDGQTASALVDAPVGVGSPGGMTNEGVTSSVDPESSIITTEDAHLGAGLFLGTGFVGSSPDALDDSTTTVSVGGISETLPDIPFIIVIDAEEMNVTAILTGPDRFTVQRAQNGTEAAPHDPASSIFTVELANLVAGEAYIVFWVTPLSGTLP